MDESLGRSVSCRQGASCSAELSTLSQKSSGVWMNRHPGVFCVLCTADNEVQALARRVSRGEYLCACLLCLVVSPVPTIPVPSHLPTPDGRSASPCIQGGPSLSSLSLSIECWV